MLGFFYLSFEGRCGRKVYWLVGVLPFLLIVTLLVWLFLRDLMPAGLVLASFVSIQLPILAMQVKRWRDAGYSVWLALLNYVPVIGVLVPLVAGVLPSRPPKSHQAGQVSAAS